MLTLRGAERGHGTVPADGSVPREGLAHAKRERGRQGMPRESAARQPLCADIDGFSLHAAVRVQAHDRKRLAALVPRPRLHLIRLHGVLAPNAKLRALVVPQQPPAQA